MNIICDFCVDQEIYASFRRLRLWSDKKEMNIMDAI